MSQLQTPVKIPSPGFAINYLDSLFLLGSCFAENIGLKLYEHKFNCQVNPFGVLYNPASIAQSIQSLMHRTEYTKDDLLKHNNIWLSFDHYTLFSKPDEKECLEGINKSFNLAKNKLKQAKTLILTFGTSAVYRFKKTGRIVSNCHKIPANEFERSFLSSDEIVDTLLPVLDKLLNTSPELKIIVTISPIRHWKDGAIENMRSKASLILAIKQLEQKLSKLYYFPVYEIYMDELRDYRFYADDMLHPSTFSVDYIWEKFKETFFAKNTLEYIKDIEKISKLLNHRPLNPAPGDFDKFYSKIKNESEYISSKYSHLNFDKELISLKEKYII